MNEKAFKWYKASSESVCQSLQTNAACGLSRKAARSRFKKQGRNPLFDDVTPQKKTPTVNLLLDPALLLMLFSSILAIFFLPPVNVISTLVIFAFLAAALVRVVYRCRELSHIIRQYRTPAVCVLRDGKVFSVSAARVVVGDILLLHTGDVVPGDCRLLSAQNLRVLTLLPNEKGKPIYQEHSKNADAIYGQGTQVDAPLAENMLYGGSEILCGEAKAVLVATGINSYLGAMRAFTVPAEIQEKNGETPTERLIGPYLRLWGFLSLVLLAVFTLIGLISKPTGGGLAEYFFILCIFTCISSPALISLYLHWVSVRGRLLCTETEPKRNRAVIKTEEGVQKLAAITDLFVIGKRGLCDGVTHFWSAFIGSREIRADDDDNDSALQPICEAMLLRHEADLRVPACDCAANVETDTVLLSELVSLCGFDAAALKVRLQNVERDSYPNRPAWQSIIAYTQQGTARFLFDSSGSLVRQCLLYSEDGRMRAITPEYRSTLRKYCEYVEENGCRTLCIAYESREGTLSLIGILALREGVNLALPSVVEELTQSSVVTRFFLADDDYAHICHLPEPYLYRSEECPHLTYALLQRYHTFIGFSKEEISALIPAYQKSGHSVAVLGGNADDRCFLRSGVLTLACDTVANLKYYAEDHIEEVVNDGGREGSRNTSQTLRRHADVIIERADRFAGGVYAALQTISHSREVEVRMQMLLQFWLHSQLARIIMVFFAVCTGIGFFSGLQMLLSGFAVEIAALYFLCDVPLSQSALRTPHLTNRNFLFGKLLAEKSIIPTFVSVFITALTTVILAIGKVVPRESVKTYFFVSLLLLQICIFFRIVRAAKIAPERNKTLILCGIFVGVFAILTLLSVLIDPFGAFTGMGFWNGILAIFLPLCPGLYLILELLLPFLDRTAK